MKSSAELVRTAWNLGVMVPSFNVPYLPMVEPIVRATRDQDAVAFVAVARLEWVKFESRSLSAVMEEYERWQDPKHVRLHLDHVPVMDEDHQRVDVLAIIKEAIALGYQSVMVDGSRLALVDNIRATRAVVELAHAAGIACEAELGAVLGHEDGPLPPYEELFKSGKGFTRVEEARQFVRESGCDWLSVAIGNIHGAVSQAARDNKKIEARLDLDHLGRLREATDIPLVLHGGSGVCREDVRAGIKRGLAKVNVGTEIRQAYEVALKASGAVAVAQQAVHARTAELIRDYFGIQGLRAALMGKT
ncbi:MAG: class II fructose-bisphosphate aldolase [Verrucomicrobia bacterium]|nr:class II fructose-bisphosphate aldolase [Verrucomicrobiota bacterium]MBU1735305.1 class II fructose-bisphosphate aldolase [Verrucomicrobiota bacterium]MBU1858159.1 class II fructose-bisphosphate aldolase [Verrucomicrobiota bacterium]